jgi:hypothetical protein
MRGWVFGSAQKEWGHSVRPPATSALLPLQEPVAARAVTLARVWSYTTFIVIEASDQQKTSGRNLKSLDKLIIIIIYTKNNH